MFEGKTVERGDAGEDKLRVGPPDEHPPRGGVGEINGLSGGQSRDPGGPCLRDVGRCDLQPGVKPKMKGKRKKINSLDLIVSRRRRRSARASGVSGAPVGWRSLFTNKRGQVLSLGGCKLHSCSSVGLVVIVFF